MANMKPKFKGIVSWPKGERPRERLLAEGANKLTEAELLAIILRVGQGTFKAGVRGQNATDFARSLLKEFNGLRGIDRAHVQDLLKACKLVQLVLLDHVIIGESKHYSYSDEGRLEELAGECDQPPVGAGSDWRGKNG